MVMIRGEEQREYCLLWPTLRAPRLFPSGLCAVISPSGGSSTLQISLSLSLTLILTPSFFLPSSPLCCAAPLPETRYSCSLTITTQMGGHVNELDHTDGAREKRERNRGRQRGRECWYAFFFFLLLTVGPCHLSVSISLSLLSFAVSPSLSLSFYGYV